MADKIPQSHDNPKIELGLQNWPTPPEINPTDPQFELRKLLYQKQLDTYSALLQARFESELAREVAATAAARTREDASTAARTAQVVAEASADVQRREQEYANYYTVFQAIQNAYLETAKDSLTSIQARSVRDDGSGGDWYSLHWITWPPL